MSWWIFGKNEDKIEDKPLEGSMANQNISIEEIESDFEKTSHLKELPSMSNHNISIEKKSNTFFVRIDRFQNARNNLSEIEKRMKEMESILIKLNETKCKEDTEIESWKEEMKTIKSCLSIIDQSLFEKTQF